MELDKNIVKKNSADDVSCHRLQRFSADSLKRIAEGVCIICCSHSGKLDTPQSAISARETGNPARVQGGRAIGSAKKLLITFDGALISVLV